MKRTQKTQRIRKDSKERITPRESGERGQNTKHGENQLIVKRMQKTEGIGINMREHRKQRESAEMIEYRKQRESKERG